MPFDTTPRPVRFLEFPDRTTASATAAGIMAQNIGKGLDTQTHCGIVVSGGTTPGECFDLLSAAPLEWSRVTVVPSDERWVPADHPDSNERLIRNRLLQGGARQGQVLSLFRRGAEPERAVCLAEQELVSPVTPFACVLLGMGEDGHFASLFPDYDGLEQALNPDNPRLLTVVKTVGSPHQRISLSLAALLNTRHTVLLIFGRNKRNVFDNAVEGGTSYPVQSLLQHHVTPLTVVWAA